MNWWTKCALSLLVVVSYVDAGADAFVAVEEKAGFCRELLEQLNDHEDLANALAPIGASSATFSHGQISFKLTPSDTEHTEGISYTSFDIDNDGYNEILVKYLTSQHGAYGELLWVVRPSSREIDFAKNPHFSSKEFLAFDSIESSSPWPYKPRGLFFVEITPFSVGGVNYLGIRDTLFNKPTLTKSIRDRSFRERSWVVAKFRGKKLAVGVFGHVTDDFQTICRFNRRR